MFNTTITPHIIKSLKSQANPMKDHIEVSINPEPIPSSNFWSIFLPLFLVN
jgi:hypothetical protein